MRPIRFERFSGGVMSAYTGNDGVKFWIITEADRSSTCVLPPAAQLKTNAKHQLCRMSREQHKAGG
jgi:hypothetical protein